MNDAEFTALMQRWQPYVYTVCFRFVQDAARAEDLTQETFLAAYLHRDSCPVGNEKFWLTRIAVNKARDHLRSAWARHVQLAEEDGDDPPALPTAADQPEQQLLTVEGYAALRQEVLALPPPYREVARAVLLEQRTPEQTAALTGRPVKTVYTQLERAKKRLRKKIGEDASWTT